MGGREETQSSELTALRLHTLHTTTRAPPAITDGTKSPDTLPSSGLPPLSPSHVRLLVASHLDSAYQMTHRAGCCRHRLHTESFKTSIWPAAMLLAAALPGESFA